METRLGFAASLARILSEKHPDACRKKVVRSVKTLMREKAIFGELDDFDIGLQSYILAEDEKIHLG